MVGEVSPAAETFSSIQVGNSSSEAESETGAGGNRFNVTRMEWDGVANLVNRYLLWEFPPEQ